MPNLENTELTPLIDVELELRLGSDDVSELSPGINDDSSDDSELESALVAYASNEPEPAVAWDELTPSELVKAETIGELD